MILARGLEFHEDDPDRSADDFSVETLRDGMFDESQNSYIAGIDV